MSPSAPPRLTKIVATIGPACDAPETLEAMLRLGVDVARVNMSHGTHSEHAARIARVRTAAERAGVPVAIMIDTKGPEVRTAPLAKEPVVLFAGDAFTLSVNGALATSAGSSVTHPALPKEVPVGATILIDDGLIELRAVEAKPDGIVCEVVCGGELGGRKSVHVQGARLSLEALSAADVADLAFAVQQDADWIAASFIREADDIVRIRDTLRRHGGDIPILAKIEDPDAVANLGAILDVADGAMVARGDLGVLLPVGEVPLVQKRVIRATVSKGKPVVTATQMLDSMERNPRPTRAEASDVANAIFDGTSAVMLSGETAHGRHPIESVRTMVDLARQAERALGDYGDLQRIVMPHSKNVTEAVAESSVALARELGAAAIVCLTETGQTARFVSKYRPPCPILAVTASPKVQRRLTISWGVTPLLHPPGEDVDRVRFAVASASQQGIARVGDVAVATAGVAGAPGSTNLIRVVSVE